MAADWTFEVVKAAVVAVLSVCAGVALERYRKSKTRSTRAAAYLGSIAGAIDEMIASIERGEKPLSSGNKLNTLIDAFDETSRRLMGEGVVEDLKTLNGLATRAENLDWEPLYRETDRSDYIMSYEITPATQTKNFQDWLADAKRLSGKFKARADILLTR